MNCLMHDSGVEIGKLRLLVHVWSGLAIFVRSDMTSYG